MNTLRRSSRSYSTPLLSLGIIVFLAILGLVLFGSFAQAHVQFSNGRWVFRGMTIDASGDRSAKSDPINIVFKGHGLEYSNDNVFSHIYDHTGWLGSGPCSHHQRVVWTKRNTSATTSDKDDYQLDNRAPGTCFFSRWHIRGWDDQEHDLFTGDHGGRNQWSVVGVHHEDNTHDIDLDWDAARRKFIKNMAGHCSWPKWKRHGGARGTIQGFFNSGWIGRISLKHTPDC